MAEHWRDADLQCPRFDGPGYVAWRKHAALVRVPEPNYLSPGTNVRAGCARTSGALGRSSVRQSNRRAGRLVQPQASAA
jgi:hypothetical protein